MTPEIWKEAIADPVIRGALRLAYQVARWQIGTDEELELDVLTDLLGRIGAIDEAGELNSLGQKFLDMDWQLGEDLDKNRASSVTENMEMNGDA